MNISEIHFTKFIEYVHDTVIWPGQKAKKWYESSFPNHLTFKVYEDLPDVTFSREAVRNYCLQENCHSDEACFWVIMSWGGMRVKNARMASASINHFLPLVSSCRNLPVASRAFLFDIFRDAQIPGLGPAFFTKLMFFLRPKEDVCYILDQWTGRSVNLLLEKPIIDIRGNWVTRKNSGAEYAQYCNIVEHITLRINNEESLDLDAFQVEEAMFSGGTNHRWRIYLESLKTNTNARSLLY